MKASIQTKSFIALLLFATIGTYICIVLWGSEIYQKVGKNQAVYNPANYRVSNKPTQVSQAQATAIEAIDTSTWSDYTNTDFGLNFKYKPDWKILKPVTKNGFTVIQLDPGSKYFNIKIYVSENSFYIMDGLPTQEETINGFKALNVNNALYGLNVNNLFFTFDVGLSMSLVPEFNALVRSVKFTK